MSSYTNKRILILTTGGTIAGNVAINNVTEEIKHDPNSFISVLFSCVDILKKNWAVEVDFEVKELFNVDSSNMLPENWTKIISAIEEDYDNFDGFIVLHGTNTMGYTCSALSFGLENLNKPVIFTGAQVPLGYLGSDATTNLVNALRLAVWQYNPIKGVLAVFGSKIIGGTRVKKGTDFDYDPFSSFQKGSIGQIGRFMKIDESALEKYNSYLSKIKPLAIQSRMLSVKKNFDTSGMVSLSEFPGMSPDIFKNLVENSNVRAFILRAFGAGDASFHLKEAFQYLKEKRIPIVVTSQAPAGVASFHVNENGRFLKENDLAIPAFDMSIESITIKLSWLLAQNFSYEDIKYKMLQDMHGEITVENESV